MDIYVDHIFIAVVKSRFSQYGKICLIFDNNGNAEFFFQKRAKILRRERIIRGKDNLIMLDNAVNANGDTDDLFFSMFKESLIFFNNR